MWGFLQAGAKHVYGIERSAIAEQAKQIVADNGYESKVTIIQGKVEEVDLPVEKVLTSHFTLSSRCHWTLSPWCMPSLCYIAGLNTALQESFSMMIALTLRLVSTDTRVVLVYCCKEAVLSCMHSCCRWTS